MLATTHDNLMSRYWHGEGRLAPLYWAWGVGGSILLSVAVAAPPLAGIAGPEWAALGIAAGGIYTLWILVSTWRCADNIDHAVILGAPREAWSWLARYLTVAWAINAAGMSAILMNYLLRPI
ncbi:MAG: hypothetical protein IT557_08665 [Alphaproteobacteria bacterium]|nr:hypothetical protein [Alphaproteobacteria bacterium]